MRRELRRFQTIPAEAITAWGTAATRPFEPAYEGQTAPYGWSGTYPAIDSAFVLLQVSSLFVGDAFDLNRFKSALPIAKTLLSTPTTASKSPVTTSGAGKLQPGLFQPGVSEPPTSATQVVRSIDELVADAQSSDRVTQNRAFSGLKRSTDPRALTALVSLLEHSDRNIRESAVYAACKGESTDPKFIEPIIRIMRERNIVSMSRYCLLTTSDRRAVGPIIEQLTPDRSVFLQAAQWLEKMTGKKFETGREWQQWWLKNKDRFAM
jgi:hypothetical protein